jgi:xanthine dehydrogenase YagS FAD-binding subunit
MLAMAGARPLAQNGFKVDLGKHAVVRALTVAADLPG